MQENILPKKFSELGVTVKVTKFVGDKIRLKSVLGVQITVHAYKIEKSKYPKNGNDTCLHLQISIEGKKFVAFSIATVLIETLKQLPETAFPFLTTIKNDNEVYEFT